MKIFFQCFGSYKPQGEDLWGKCVSAVNINSPNSWRLLLVVGFGQVMTFNRKERTHEYADDVCAGRRGQDERSGSMKKMDRDELKVYPNPNSGQFTVNRVQGTVDRVQVYDVYGKLLKTVEVNGNTVELDVRELASGMYFVRISTEKGVVTKSFVKK